MSAAIEPGALAVVETSDGNISYMLISYYPTAKLTLVVKAFVRPVELGMRISRGSHQQIRAAFDGDAGPFVHRTYAW